MKPGILFHLVAICLVSVSRAAPFVKGADVGWLQQMEATGYRFKDRNGKSADCLEILRQQGINTLRLRVWVNPSDNRKSGHCSRDEVAAMAERGHKMGFRILIDFHYSDSWADPGKQTKPAAWKDHGFEQLKKDVYDHTADVLKALKVRGVTPEWIQIGNEIRDGMLWPDGQASKNPAQLAALINEGYRATKANDPATRVIVHLDRGNDRQLYQWFFDLLEKNHANYDIIGLSYYPYWLKEDYRKSIDDLGKNLIAVAERYHKEVMVVEVGGEDSQPDDTREMLTAVMEKVRTVPDHHGLGVIYWEPQGARSWSGYRLSAWGDDGRPTRVLDAFLDPPAAASPSPAR